MSFLTAAQSAAIRLLGKKPNTFFSSTGTFELQICDLASEVAKDIMKSHDWRVLTKTQTMAGDGVTTTFDLPSDYDRMPLKAAVTRENWYDWSYTQVNGLDQWRDLLNGGPTISPGFWVILNGQMHFKPAISAGESAQFYYISKNIVRDADLSTKPAFTKDDDSLIVDERLLTLGLIWKWRELQGIPRPGDQENFDKALSEETSRDKGSRMFAEGIPRMPASVRNAYPGTLG
jgi:hypothetical protein